MSIELKRFFNEYVHLSDAETEEIIAKFHFQKVKKNEFVLKQGMVCKDLVFVQSGCLRLFYIHDEIEVSVWFALKHSSAIEMYSFISGQPSDYFCRQ